ncbi:juvenile hormone acid O-methyltransferase [Bicyclus anynana]|uniref:Juvenile hormone acid O-methyltransferase n=1 Tax=Bicyclus anynana TaxID=110368 RepID=A0A6J1N0S6_BICAN|nr:juvenile hormone acid O-methyltransferase [Bicyclus anynana]XP_023936451.1 juvenile hormone acid O-methyltransferase [Bicyclus anynana]
MNNAELYQQSNTLQKRDALQCLEEYAKKIKWKNDGDTVIDIGCGDGSVTSSILKTFLPYNYKKLVGCDISEKMVQFANKHHATSHTSFKVLDIEGRLPDEMRGNFDHAFSFYALHWIKHQETAFTNIYKLLGKGGDCLLIFLGHMPVFDVYRILARSPKWSYWLKDVDQFVSPYHDSRDPEKEIKRMMTSIGFTGVEVKCIGKSYIYTSVEALKRAVSAVSPFKLPADMQDSFLEDYVKIVRDMQLINHVNNNINHVNISTNYHLLVVYGKK